MDTMTTRPPAPPTTDCYARAEPDEPRFTLLARDPHAAGLVDDWANRREKAIAVGHKPESDRPKVAEARELAHKMRQWRVGYLERKVKGGV